MIQNANGSDCLPAGQLPRLSASEVEADADHAATTRCRSNILDKRGGTTDVIVEQIGAAQKHRGMAEAYALPDGVAEIGIEQVVAGGFGFGGAANAILASRMREADIPG